MNYQKLVVLLCLGSHLLVGNSVVIAGWNPLKKLKKEVRKLTKPIESAADEAAASAVAAAREAANRAAQEAARLAAEEAAKTQALAAAARDAATIAAQEAARLAALAERAALVDTRFVASELTRSSATLEAMTPALRFLQGTALSATSEMYQVEQELERMYPKVLNLSDMELIAQLAQIRSVLEKYNSLDLLRFWEPGWIEKVESRVAVT
jgi:hypothetical protein